MSHRSSSSGRLAERAWAFGRALVSEIGDDRLLGLAAESAFFVVLSFFPGLLIVAGALGVLESVVGPAVAADVQQTVTDAMNRLLTDQASGAVDSVQALFTEQRGGLLTFATLGALVSLSGAFATVIGALNLAYETSEQRSWWRRRLVGLTFALATVVVTAVVLAAMVVGPFLGAGGHVADTLGVRGAYGVAWEWLRYPVAFVAVTVWAGALFHFGPNRRTPWRSALPGALATAVLWLVASLGFHVYLVSLGSTNPVLGSFGGGLIVMMWVYLLSLALLVGGELNATLYDRRADRVEQGGDEQG
jgi:membrane protein